jgi:RND family efflux transporter MFP subunit
MAIATEQRVKRPRAAKPRRRGRRTALAVLVLALLAAGGWAAGARLWPGEHAELIVEKTRMAVFIHDVVDRGEVESSANVDVVCEVQSQNAEGVRIIQIVPEGKVVEKGDFLVKLDDAKLRTDRATQQIAVNTAAAALAQAENELAANVIAKDEYEFGTFKQDEKKLESELFVAEENIRRAENTLKFSAKMAARGYINQLKLEADRFAVEKNRKELEVAQVKLDVLREYTKAKTLKKHESDINTSKAKVQSERAKHDIETDKLAQIESQLAKCEIQAPIAGQVVYPELERWRGNGESAIRAGTRVREQQVIIRLPDPKKMQVKAKISEARVDRVKPGMTVEIQLDALLGVKLHGVVKTVNPYPSNDNWFLSNIKEYATFIEIADAPPALRSGMSAHVAIRVETIDSALQVPVQAVVERGGKFYCLLRDAASKLLAREVLIGSTNDKFLVIREGLAEGQEVVLNPRAHLDEVGLPAIDVEAPKLALKQQQASSPQAETPATPGSVETAATAATVADPPVADEQTAADERKGGKSSAKPGSDGGPGL